MYFVGIITNDRSKKYLRKIVNEQIKSEKLKFIFITEKNAENMKNIYFETIVVNEKVEWIENIKDNLIKAKYIILNSDISIDFKLFRENNLRIINYGFNSKATITLSSNTEDSVQICVQRNILNKNENIEQQEICLIKNHNSDIYDIMLLVAILLIYNKTIISLLKL